MGVHHRDAPLGLAGECSEPRLRLDRQSGVAVRDATAKRIIPAVLGDPENRGVLSAWLERERGIRILHRTFALVSIRADSRPLQEKMRVRWISANRFAPHRKSPLVHGHGYRVGCIVVLERCKERDSACPSIATAAEF
jgi:hypothetical protein